MKKFLLSLLLLFGLLAPTFAITDICDITIAPDSRVAAFANGEDVTVTMSFTTDEAAGVRIFARPYTNGSLTPAYSASGSPIYMGAGMATGSFTITAGDVIVDEIRIEVKDADNNTLLRRCWVPVRFHFGTAGVHHFTYSDNPDFASFLLNEDFTTTFQYNVSYPGGVKVFIRPFTKGNLTPGYSASGSGTYSGTGTINSNFSITAGENVIVDALRVQVTNASQTLVLDEFFIPVNLGFSTVKITDIITESGNFPYNNEDRSVDFNYSTTESAGVRVFPRPWTNGNLTPNYTATGSNLYMGSGTATGTFTIESTNQRVDHVRFQVTNADQSEVLLEMLFPVEYTFGNFLIENIELCPAAPAHLEYDEPVNVNYHYYNDEGMDTRIFVRPFSNGALSPDYAASGSGSYASGGGSAADNISISSGNVLVDQLRFEVTNSDQSTVLATYFIPVHYEFGNVSVAATAPADIVEAISVFPNPTVDDAFVSVTLKEPQHVRVSVTDLTGKLMLDLGVRDLTAQAQEQWRIEGGKLSNGAYIILVEGEGFKTAYKYVVMK